MVRYILQKLCVRFVMISAGLIPLFATCDFLVRLAAIPFSFKFLKFFVLMMPLVAVFALPIATCLSVGITIGNIFARNELLLIQYFPTIRKQIEKAVLVFSLGILILYIPVLFELAPRSYWQGKKFLLQTIQLQVESLAPQQFHKIASRCTIFFKHKTSTHDGHTKFEDILLMVKEKPNDKGYLISAKTGILQKGILELFEGTIYSGLKKKEDKNHCVASFKSLEIAFERMFFNKDVSSARAKKFLTTKELVSSIEDKGSFKELHKRIIQILWQILLPFLVLWLMMLLGGLKSNLLLSVIVSGVLFLFSYVSTNMSYFFLKPSIVPMLAFYSVPIITSGFIYRAYKRKWR